MSDRDMQRLWVLHQHRKQQQQQFTSPSSSDSEEDDRNASHSMRGAAAARPGAAKQADQQYQNGGVSAVSRSAGGGASGHSVSTSNNMQQENGSHEGMSNGSTAHSTPAKKTHPVMRNTYVTPNKAYPQPGVWNSSLPNGSPAYSNGGDVSQSSTPAANGKTHSNGVMSTPPESVEASDVLVKQAGSVAR